MNLRIVLFLLFTVSLTAAEKRPKSPKFPQKPQTPLIDRQNFSAFFEESRLIQHQEAIMNYHKQLRQYQKEKKEMLDYLKRTATQAALEEYTARLTRIEHDATRK